MRDWHKFVNSLCIPNVVVALVGNKTDLEAKYSQLSSRKVSYDEAFSLAQSLGMSYTETSALADENVLACFRSLSQAIHGRVTSSALVPDNYGTQGVKFNSKKRLNQLQKQQSNADGDTSRLSKSTPSQHGSQGQTEQDCCG